MRFNKLVMVVLVLMGAAAFAEEAGPTPYPDQKDEAAWPGNGPIRVGGWMTDNRKAFWPKREADQGKVVFVGDSLLGGWKDAQLKKNFPDLKIANRAVGGDTSRGVLFRFKEDVLDLHPSAIVFCVGSNDLSAHGDPKAAESNIQTMIDMARGQNPKVPIVLCQILPRDAKDAPTKPGAHKDLNERIVKLAEGKENMAVVDSFTALADENGKPVPELFAKDKIHPVAAGYDKWAEVLKPALEKLGIK